MAQLKTSLARWMRETLAAIDQFPMAISTLQLLVTMAT